MTRCPNCDELMDIDRDCFSCPHKGRGKECNCKYCEDKRKKMWGEEVKAQVPQG